MIQDSVPDCGAWTREEVDSRLNHIVVIMHESCVKYGTEESGFIKVADAMLAQGVV